jgi:hypothetical protein
MQGNGDGGDLCIFNGLDGATGEYLVPPMTAEEVVEVLMQRPLRAERRAMMPGLDPRNLAEAGWGAIFHRDADPALREALEALLRHRKEQAGGRYREFTAPTATAPAMSPKPSSPASASVRVRSIPGACPITCSSSAIPRPSLIPFKTSSMCSMQSAASSSTRSKNTRAMPSPW